MTDHVIRPTVTIGIQPNTRLLRIERINRDKSDDMLTSYHAAANRAAAIMLGDDACTRPALCGAWLIWINANIDFTQGTFIKLNDDGTIDRVTVNPDGSEDVFVIKKRGD